MRSIRRLSRFGLLALLFCVAHAALAQTAPGVKHVYAFVRQHQPGNIAVDPDGKPMHAGPDTLYTVYVETDRQGIEWKKAYIDGRMYDVTARPVTATPFGAGTDKRSGRKIWLPAAKGNRLWQLDLGLTDAAPVYPRKTEPGKILLEGKRGNRKIVVKVSDVVELSEIPSV